MRDPQRLEDASRIDERGRRVFPFHGPPPPDPSDLPPGDLPQHGARDEGEDPHALTWLDSRRYADQRNREVDADEPPDRESPESLPGVPEGDIPE